MSKTRLLAVFIIVISCLGDAAFAADSTPPEVFPTAPQDGSTVSGSNVTVSASASDDVAVAGVQFKLDGANLGSEVTSAPYSFIWDSRQASNGIHTIKAVARDTSGNTATSFSITVTVNNAADATAPTVSLIAPAAGATVSGSVTVSAGASDNVGVAGVQFKLDGVNLGAEVTAPTPSSFGFGNAYSLTWNTVQTANGPHTLTAVARDGAGNQTTSAAVAVTVNNAAPDTTAPAVSLTAPLNGATVSGSSVTVSASASDNVGVVGVQFKLDGANLGSEDTTVPYSQVWNSMLAANGPHTLTAVARDAAGNQTTASAVTVTVSNTSTDTIPPTISLTAPLAGATVSGSSVAVSASASDNVGILGVQFKLDGANLGSEDTTAPYSIVWDTRQVANGLHTLTAIARDAAGNQTTASGIDVTVSNTTTDTTPPIVSLTAPTGGSTVSGSSVTVSASASDNVGVIGVQFKLDGMNLGAEDTTAPYSVVWDSKQATNGQHTLTAVARDGGGNQTTSQGVTVTVSNTTPDTSAPTVSITNPAADSTVSGSTIVISATASDNIGVVGVQFKLDGVNLGSEDLVQPYSIVWNTTTSSNGPHVVTAIARDAAGNQTTSSAVAVTVNNLDPNALTFALPDRGGDLWTTLPSDALTAGYVRVQTSGGAAAPTGVAVLGFRNAGILVSEAGVPASAPLASGRVYVDFGGGVNTGVAIANQNKIETLIQFFFNDVDGKLLWFGSMKVCAGCQMSGFLNQRPFFPTQSFRGTFTFYAWDLVSVVALRGFTNERNEFLITTLPVVPLSSVSNSSTMTLPEFADGGGWSTQVILVNPTEAPISGNVEFWGPGSASEDGKPLSISVNGTTGSVFSYTLPAAGVARFVTANTSPSVQVGSVRITSASQTVLPQAMAIFSLKTNDTTISEASVPGAESGLAFRTYLEFSTEKRIDAGVGIANPSASAVTVSLEITTLDGRSTGLVGSVQIPAGGQITKFVSELFPALPPSLTGVLRLASPTPINVIGLRARYSERGTFLITTIPVANEAAAVSPSTEIVFPHVVSGGGYDTNLILFSSSSGPSTVGNLRFFTPAGAPAVRLSH